MGDFFLVIPTRDRLDYLVNLLYDLKEFEPHISKVVIVDQSRKSIKTELEKLDLNFSFHYVKNDRENSVNHSRNLALEFYSNEEWLFFLDDDLRIPAIAFKQIIEHLSPNIIDVLIPGILFDGMNEREFSYDTVLDTISKPHNFSKGRFRLQVCSGLNIVKADIFKEAGFFFDENFSIWGDDWDYGMRLLKAGANIYFQPKILVEHLGAAVGGQRDKQKQLDFQLEKECLYFYFLRKHFSEAVVKQEFYLSSIKGMIVLVKQQKFTKLKNIFKGYRMSKKMKYEVRDQSTKR